MRRNRYEQETSITFNNEEAEAILWTCQPAMLRKFEKAGINAMRIDGEGRAFKIPKKWIVISLNKKPKNLSEEQRKVIADRLKAFRNQK